MSQSGARATAGRFVRRAAGPGASAANATSLQRPRPCVRVQYATRFRMVDCTARTVRQPMVTVELVESQQ